MPRSCVLVLLGSFVAALCVSCEAANPSSDHDSTSVTTLTGDSGDPDTQSASAESASDTSDPSEGTASTASEPDATDTLPADCVHPEVVADCTDGYCAIPAGCFVFGSPVTEPCRGKYTEKQTVVYLTHDFVIGQTETTQDQWEALGLRNPSHGTLCADCPVNSVTWADTLVFLNALSKRDGLEPCYDLSNCHGVFAQGYLGDHATGLEYACDEPLHRFPGIYDCPGWRLPTMAEWSYAARAGTTTATYNGEPQTDGREGCVLDSTLEPIAWHCGNTTMAMAVALKKPNAWGLYDMLGNLVEWTNDWLVWGQSIAPGKASIVDPIGTSKTRYHAIIGGNFIETPCYSRASWFVGGDDYATYRWAGFRAARTLFPRRSRPAAAQGDNP